MQRRRCGPTHGELFDTVDEVVATAAKLTGFAGGVFVWIAAGLLLLGAMAVVFTVVRRSRGSEE